MQVIFLLDFLVKIWYNIIQYLKVGGNQNANGNVSNFVLERYPRAGEGL